MVLRELVLIVLKNLVFWFPGPIGLVGITRPFHKILQLVSDKLRVHEIFNFILFFIVYDDWWWWVWFPL